MHGDTLAARDVSNDLFAADWIAAFRAINQQVVETFDLKLGIASDAKNPLDNRSDFRFFFRRRLLQSIRGETGNDLFGGNLSKSDRREQILHFARTVLGQHRLKLFAIEQILYVLLVLARFLFQHLPAELDRFLALLFGEPVTDFVPRA